MSDILEDAVDGMVALLHEVVFDAARSESDALVRVVHRAPRVGEELAGDDARLLLGGITRRFHFVEERGCDGEAFG